MIADRGYAIVAGIAAFLAVVAVGYLIWMTVAQTGETWSTFGVWGFITGTQWIPATAVGTAVYGALPFIYGTLMTSAIALVLAVPTSIGIALATTVFLPRRMRGPVGGFINLLAAVPSVIFGLWGVTVLVPFLRPALDWLANTLGGFSLFGWTIFAGPVTSGSFLVSGLVLAIMIVPIITAITREVLLTVPRDQQEAAYALGATRWEMVKHAMLPWARSGIVGASALGLGRAVGETIAIAMLLGNSPVIFGSLLGPGATLASVIALQTGEASGLQLSALTALAVVLFLMAFAINAAARVLVRRGEGTGRTGGGMWSLLAFRRSVPTPAPQPAPEVPATAEAAGAGAPAEVQPWRSRREPLPITGPDAVARKRRVRSGIAETLIWVSLGVGIVPLVAIMWEMLYKGLPAISASFFTELPPLDPNSYGGGISNALVGTLILMGIATIIAAPIGVLTALFISDVSKPTGWQKRVADGIGFFVDVLLGVPSIVVGLIVYLGIVVVQEQFSALAGGIALAIIMFPIVVRSADEMLRLVPVAQKEAASALGAPKWRVTWSIVLPAAGPGILTGILLGLARASGETAPLLFTSLGNQFFSTSITEPIASIPQLIYQNTIQVQTDASLQLAWGAALVLVAIILILNLGAALLARRTRPLEAR
ncbi:MAG: phosphate ABC transporter permease subunit PstC [Acidobacteria bacterium]|nr:phosphate ABC transporter permease subunit PstC [Acidobacteriota bacterium]